MKCVPCLPDKLKQSGIFSTFVAVCLFVAWLMIGGAVLEGYEGANEKKMAGTMDKDKQTLKALADQYITNSTDRANFTASFNNLVKWASSKQPAPNSQALNWNFKGSCFFVFTIMTTIGYGSFSPYTDGGQAAVLWVGVVGLVVGVVTTAMLSANLNKAIDLILEACKCKEGLAWKKSAIICVLTMGWWFIFGALYTAKLGSSQDGYWDGFYYTFVTLTTIGFGDYVIDYHGDSFTIWWWTTSVVIGLVLFGAAFGCVTDPLTNLLASEEPEADDPQNDEKTNEETTVKTVDNSKDEKTANSDKDVQTTELITPEPTFCEI